MTNDEHCHSEADRPKNLFRVRRIEILRYAQNDNDGWHAHAKLVLERSEGIGHVLDKWQ